MNQRMRLYGLVIFASAAALSSSCQSRSLPTESSEVRDLERIPTAVELHDIFKNGSHAEIIEAINKVKQYQDEPELVNFLQEIWSKTGPLQADIPTQRLDNNVIRLNIVDTLMQANANGFASVDTADMRAFARSLTTSAVAQEAMSAASALGRSANKQDIEVLESALRDSRDEVFRSAALSLAFGCHEQASTAIDEYRIELKDGARRNYIDKILKDRKQLCEK